MKESLARITAWVKAHPIPSLLILAGVILAGWFLSKRVKVGSSSGSLTGETGGGEGESGGGSFTNPGETAPGETPIPGLTPGLPAPGGPGLPPPDYSYLPPSILPSLPIGKESPVGSKENTVTLGGKEVIIAAPGGKEGKPKASVKEGKPKAGGKEPKAGGKEGKLPPANQNPANFVPRYAYNSLLTKAQVR